MTRYELHKSYVAAYKIFRKEMLKARYGLYQWFRAAYPGCTAKEALDWMNWPFVEEAEDEFDDEFED